MENKLKLAKDILKKYNQEHLLYFYDELTQDEKEKLLNQILTIDFEKILTLYKNSLNFHYDTNIKISPIPHIEKDRLSAYEINYYSKIGEAIIRSNEFAVVTMAGGQGTRLGYKVSVNDEYIAIYNKEKSDNVPYSMTLFYFNSTSIKHMIFNKMVDYQAVCESIKNDEGNWIPLEQALFLMNSSYMIQDSYILIDKPEKNITDIYLDILKENQKYEFDFTEDIGISEDNLSKMEKVSFLVQQLNGLLKNDGASWLQAFNNFGLDNSVYDKKYTEQFAMLFCTYSDDEFKKEIKDVNDKMSLFNGNSVMSKTIKALNKQQTEKIDDLENELWKIISVNGSNTAKYNSTYKELEKLCKQDKSLKKITALYNSVQDELKNVTEPFDKVMALAEVIEYLEEFVNQDEFAIKVLSDFSSDTELSCNMSLAMKKELLNYSDTLKSNIINYSAKRYLSENYSKLISKGLNLSEALPGSATLMLIAWDII